jgi:phage-related holin
MLVMIVTLLGRALGSSVFCRNTVVIFFTANEALSVLENIGLMGVKYPQWLKTALEVLNKNADNANSQTIGDLAVGGAVVQVSETTIKNEDGE